MEFFLTFLGYLATLVAAVIVIAVSLSFIALPLPARPHTQVVAHRPEPLTSRPITRKLVAEAVKNLE